MTDKLTVTSGSTPNAPARSADGEALRKPAQELERLQQIVKKHYGRVLEEKVLANIIARQRAKLAEKDRLTETKTAFETDQAKEKLATKKEGREIQTRKALGTEQAKGADGLTNEARMSVRSNPEAGPTLPPTKAPQVSAGQAELILFKMLDKVEVDGKKLDLEAYAKSLKEKPPTPVKALPLANKELATSRSALAAGASSVPNQDAPGTRAPGARPPVPQPRTPSVPGLRSPLGEAGSAPALASSAAGLHQTSGAHTWSPGFSQNAGGMLVSGIGVSRDGWFNAGGGLITGSSFDGMHFNWEAFFMNFIIKSTKDMMEWRKLLKELRRLEAKSNLAGLDLKIAMEKMHQEWERFHAISKFMESLQPAADAIQAVKQEQKLGELFGGDSEAVDKLKTERSAVEKQLADIEEKKKKASGTSSEALEKQKAELESKRKQLDKQIREAKKAEKQPSSGTLNELASGTPPDPAKREAFNKEIKDLMRHPNATERLRGKWYELRAEREAAQRRVDHLNAEHKKVATDKTKAPDVEGKLKAAEAELKHLEKKTVILGGALAMGTSASDRAKAHESYKAERGEKADPAVGKYLEDTANNKDPAGEQSDSKKAADTAAAAGNILANQRAPGTLHTVGKFVLKGLAAADESGKPRAMMIEAVNRAVEVGLSFAKRNKGETDQLMRQSISHAQGMINQLIQVQRMSRSR
jgi:hypothetical protein